MFLGKYYVFLVLDKTKRFFFSGVTAEDDTRGVTDVGVLDVTVVDMAFALVEGVTADLLTRGSQRLSFIIFYI
jgi:hypothetical protein